MDIETALQTLDTEYRSISEEQSLTTDELLKQSLKKRMDIIEFSKQELEQKYETKKEEWKQLKELSEKKISLELDIKNCDE